jgi:UDP-N-acetyl-D-mannosaminuronic acid dehydrogenase
MDKSALDVCIVGGFGHVGLPLGIVLSDAGLRVGLLDIDESKRAQIEGGKMPFIEYGADPMLKRVIGKKLTVCSSIADIAKARIIVITIGTPVDEYLSPKTRPFFELADSLLPHLHGGQCIVLRSTVFPGTSKMLSDYLEDRGKKVALAFCPERIVQGYAIEELKTLPQVVAGTSVEAVRIATELFSTLGVESIEVSLEEAELTKLFLNAWRYIQFAVGNQFYMMTTERGLDYESVYKAMTHHYGRGAIPKPGFAAGPCLLKDTMQLASAFRNQFTMGHGAMMVNEGLPSFLVDQLIAKGIHLRGATVGILGMAFKAEIDDTRDSLSFKLKKILRFHGAEVLCSDEYATSPDFVGKEELVQKSSIIIVGVPHKAYKDLKVPSEKNVVDLWGVISRS